MADFNRAQRLGHAPAMRWMPEFTPDFHDESRNSSRRLGRPTRDRCTHSSPRPLAVVDVIAERTDAAAGGTWLTPAVSGWRRRFPAAAGGSRLAPAVPGRV